MSKSAPAAPAATSVSPIFAGRPGAQVEPVDLSGMEELLTPPAAGAAPAEPAETVADPAGEAQVAATTEPADEPEIENEEPVGDGSIADGIAALQKENEGSGTAAKEKADAKAAADKEAADKAAAAKPATTERDTDLKLPEQTTAHVHPKTRKLIEERNAKITAARDERDRLVKEKTDLEAALSEERAKAKTAVVPKQLEEEVKTLRERVRELDITKDPEIETKYDRPITENNDRVIETLKTFGFGTRLVDGKHVPAPEDVQALLKSGISLKTLKPYLDELDKIGEADAAETIREAIRENARLGRSKQTEIETWKKDYDGRISVRTQQQQQEAEQASTQIRTVAQAEMKAEVEALVKDFPYILPPPAPEAKDAPAVRDAKQKALDEFNASADKVKQITAAFNPNGLPADKAYAAQGKLNAAAVKGVLLSQHVLPRVIREMKSKDARIAELEADLGKLRKAGTVSRAHAAAAIAPAGAAPAVKNTGDLASDLASFAREQGVSV